MSAVVGDHDSRDTLWGGLAVELAIGTGIGVIAGNLGVWIDGGLAVGIALGIGWSYNEN